MTLDEFITLAASDARWRGVRKLPWQDPSFSTRMLREHLSQLHDGASRRMDTIERHIAWIHNVLLEQRPQRILDLGCGPGLYTRRLAALGHDCVGVDLGPAAIDYARAHAGGEPSRERYVLGDFTNVTFDEPCDLAMLIHGEFNTLTRDEAAGLLRRLAARLAPHGRLLLEVHPLSAVEAIGRRPRAWFPLESGLFGDHRHLRLDESRWAVDSSSAVSLNWVIEPATGSVERFGTTTQGYSDGEYSQLFIEAGFTRHEQHPSLTGDASDPAYVVLVASL